MSEQGKENAVQHLGGAPCRADEFNRWPRILLQREREHLSRIMANQAGYLKPEDKDAIMHDLQDIDYFLARETEGLVKTPAFSFMDLADSVPFEMWPQSEGPVPPSQR